jgi:outer membrane protein
MNPRMARLAFAAVLVGSGAVARADDVAVERIDSVPLNSLRAGIYYLTFHVSATDVSGPFIPPGSGLNLSLKDVTTAYVAYVRTLSPHWSVELALGVPPVTTTIGKGPATVGSVPFNGQELLTARWLAPSLLMEYTFFDESQPLRPYVGLGINYTKFYDRQVTPQGEAVAGGPTSVSLPVSVSPTATVGLAYKATKHLGFYASYSWSDVHTKATLDTAGNLRTSYIHFNPTPLVISVGYSF